MWEVTPNQNALSRGVTQLTQSNVKSNEGVANDKWGPAWVDNGAATQGQGKNDNESKEMLGKKKARPHYLRERIGAINPRSVSSFAACACPHAFRAAPLILPLCHRLL